MDDIEDVEGELGRTLNEKTWQIGVKARELDEKSMRERMKIEKRSIKKVFMAFLIYFVIIWLFSFIL